MVCIWHSIQEAIASNVDIVHYFSLIVWSLNILLLIFFLIELLLREVKWRKLPHAYLMVMLSMVSSIISSTFFLLSQNHLFSQINTFCLFGPIIGLSFRSIAKHFTWAFYIIRGQMVMESMDKCSTKIAKKAPYMLITQCILITSLIITFTETEYISSINTCFVSFPLWLLICSALIGELFYGLGFMNLFYKAMTTSLEHVYNSINPKAANSIKRQIRHHIIIYSVQLIISLLFLCIVSLCICFNTLVFFEAELFISNLCLLLLFRKKNKVFSKLLCCFKDARNINTHISAISNNITPKPQSSKTDNIRSENTICKHITNQSVHQFVQTNVDSNDFLSDNWKGNKTIHDLKAAIKLSQAAPKLNAKALEMLGVSTVKNKVNKLSPLPPNKTPDSEPSIEIIIETDNNYINNTELELNIPSINTFRQSTSGILSRIYDNENIAIDIENKNDFPDIMNLNDLPRLNKSQSLITAKNNNINDGNIINDNNMPLRLPKLDNIGTKSDPLWTLTMKHNFYKQKQKDLESSPSVHLLEDIDFMEKQNSNTTDYEETTPKSLSSFTNAFVNKLKNGINQIQKNKRKQSNSKSKSNSKTNSKTLKSQKQSDNKLIDDMQLQLGDVNNNVIKLENIYSSSDPYTKSKD